MKATRREVLRRSVAAGFSSAMLSFTGTKARAACEHKGIALAIGLNRIDRSHYGSDGKLTACEADAKDIITIAKAKGFELYGTTGLMLTEQAKREPVKNAIADVARKLHKGDIFLIHYSGHGGQLPDRSGDEDDGKDETWCLYDGQLIDDELFALWGKFEAGVRILMLSDSCHSGTVAKTVSSVASVKSGAFGLENELKGRDISHLPRGRDVDEGPADTGERPAAFRTLPDEVLANAYFANRQLYDKQIADAAKENPSGNDAEVKASLLLISGCQDNQLSMDGTFNGLFTGVLKRIWQNGAFTGDYRRFHRRIQRLMPPTQTPRLSNVGTFDEKYVSETPFSI